MSRLICSLSFESVLYQIVQIISQVTVLTPNGVHMGTSVLLSSIIISLSQWRERSTLEAEHVQFPRLVVFANLPTAALVEAKTTKVLTKNSAAKRYKATETCKISMSLSQTKESFDVLRTGMEKPENS